MDWQRLVNLYDWERAAQEKLSPMVRAYYGGGAADDLSLNANRRVWDTLKLRPRVLVDVSHRNPSTSLMGQPMAYPIVIAPTAMAMLAHPSGESGIAEAAQQRGIIQGVSTLANQSIQTVRQLGATNWMQLYVYKDRQLTERLIQNAQDSRCQALVLTVDAPLLGMRENMMRLGFQLPTGLCFGNFQDVQQTEGAQVLRYIQDQFDPSLTFADLKWLVQNCAMPVWVKGVLRADDAKKAVDCGIRGIVVSNHGGRQLDTAITAAEALPEIALAVGRQVELMVDGGIRRGTDILKALALGARAVMVGRPILWGLALAGAQGVGLVLDILIREFDHAMALSGCAKVQDITSDLLDTHSLLRPGDLAQDRS
ncbi:MAG: alpha-hydroxy-acid oxidizing protein [Acidobacteria bacterium]|nr:alpha-hydroxy-acid oxidizing protein [Acidobacteriota bacterium]